jgi:hypothetical protein
MKKVNQLMALIQSMLFQLGQRVVDDVTIGSVGDSEDGSLIRVPKRAVDGLAFVHRHDTGAYTAILETTAIDMNHKVLPNCSGRQIQGTAAPKSTAHLKLDHNHASLGCWKFPNDWFLSRQYGWNMMGTDRTTRRGIWAVPCAIHHH